MGIEIKLDSHIKDFLQEFPEEMNRRMWDCVKVVQERAVDSMRNTTKQSKGVRRAKSGKGQFHYPSDPYNPPAIDFGQLSQNVVGEVGHEWGSITGYVGVKEGIYYDTEGKKVAVGDVAVWMEFGNSRVLPRPWLEPAFVHESDKVKRTLGKEMT